MRFVELLGSDTIAALVSDPRQPDNPIVECNDAFLDLTGYDREEVIGRNCRFLSGPGTDPDQQQVIRDAIESQKPVVVELLNYRKDGSSFLNSVMVAPLYHSDSCLVGFVGSQHEVKIRQDEFVREREARAVELAARLSPRQKEVLSRLARGKRSKAIGHDLGVSERTVKMHRAALRKALGVKSTAEAIRIAVRAKL